MDFVVALVVSWIFSTVVSTTMATRGSGSRRRGDSDDDGTDHPPRRLTTGHEEHETEETPVPPRRGRGQATLERAERIRRQLGGRIPVIFGEDGGQYAPVGEYGHHVAQVIGNFTTHRLPQHHRQFSDIPRHLVDAIWPWLEEWFNVADWRASPEWPKIVEAIMYTARKRYVDNRTKKKGLYLSKGIRPVMPDDEWELLKKLWEVDEQHQKRSAASIKNRQKQGASAGHGSLSFANIRDRILRKAKKPVGSPEQGSPSTPPVPPISGFWQLIGKKPDGSWRDPRFATADAVTQERVTQMTQSSPGTQPMTDADKIAFLREVSRDAFTHTRGWQTGIGPSRGTRPRQPPATSGATYSPPWGSDFYRFFNRTMKNLGCNNRFCIPDQVLNDPERAPET